MKLDQTSRLRYLVAYLTVGFLGGCASSLDIAEGSEYWQEAQREIIEERVRGRWESLIKHDFDGAYNFLSPVYRGVVSSQQYRSKFGAAVGWRSVNVKSIGYDSGIVASVRVEVAYRAPMPGVRSEWFENKRDLFEKWIYKDGKWWYTDQ